ncbi:MAG: pyroglutamyl-peptidase I [Hydrogenophaga sp.]|nr:pyroglutamyl-peptidase I [Hydrogenophaga sp.]
MTRVLLTGFEPFDGDDLNPSWEVALALDGERLGNALVQSQQLPCVFGSAREVLWQTLASGSFDVLLSLGLAGNRPDLTVERIAINVDDARIPDNAGQQPVDVPVVAGGPAAYWASLPIKRMVAAVRAAGVPASVSQTAGTFVCNHVFYAGAHWQATRQPGLRVGFMHLPLLLSQAVGKPGFTGMALDTQVLAVRAALAAALEEGEDIHSTGGAVS